MHRFCPRILVLFILALALTNCGSGPATQPAGATEAASPTPFVLPPETTPTLFEDTSPSPADTGNATLAPADDTAVISIETPAEPTSGDSAEAASMTPTFEGLDNVPTRGKTSVARCNDALFIDDITIPDGTVMLPGKEFVKTWRFQNFGSCIWSAKFSLGFAYGDPLRGVETKLPHAVNPGQMVDISIKMIAPDNNGWYGGWWRLKTDTGVNFGEFVYVSIQVTAGRPSTPTP